MVASGVTPTLPVDEARVVVVCPEAHLDYRNVVRTIPLGQRFLELETVEDVVRATLVDPPSFAVVSQDEIIRQLRGDPSVLDLENWLEYPRVRYGW